MSQFEGYSSRLFASPRVHSEHREDGCTVLRSGYELNSYDRCVGEWLIRWAHAAPTRPFLLERSAGGTWTGVTYADALNRVEGLAGWLLSQGLSIEHPLAILCDNSVEHGLLSLAAQHVGIPVVPVSSSYSLVSRDFGKLKSIFSQISPGAVYVAEYERFEPALTAVRNLYRGVVIVGSGTAAPADAVSFDEILASGLRAVAVQHAFARITPDTIAKVLFTSGSTGNPKGVINTHRMLCSNQEATLQLWPFVLDAAPVMVDWLPWNHTFGGNFNFNLVLRNGGTLYIDSGRAAPGLFDTTVSNLREIAPTLYCNVPRGFDLLLAALSADKGLRSHFFSRVQLMVYAAAALPQHLWDALVRLATQTLGHPIPLVSGWGSTETAPVASLGHFQTERSGNIGVPIPGCELKLCPNENKLEVRVRGPNVTPGYLGAEDTTRQSFDEEGFYRIGDAVRLVDAKRPELGLYFDGRVSEDFKLATGTWVSVGTLRTAGIEALAPLAQDIVVAGQDRNEIGFLIFPNASACRAMCPDLPAESPLERVLGHPTVVEHIRRGLQRLRAANTGSSTYAVRALLMSEPPSIDGGEITDKGYINQRAVLARRSELITALYAPDWNPQVIRCV